MKTITSNEANRLLEATWGIYGIQAAIQQLASNTDNDDLDTTLYNLACALKVLVDNQHELACEWGQEAEGAE